MSLTLSWVWNIKTLGQKAMGHKPNGLEVRKWKAHYQQTFYSSKRTSNKHCSMQRFDKRAKLKYCFRDSPLKIQLYGCT